jgi:hypothetical protein
MGMADEAKRAASGGEANRRRVLRRFGLVMAAALAVLAALLLWRQRPAGPYLLAAAAAFALAAAAAPRALDPLERAWMRLAEALSVVMTFVVLTLAFFLVVTPLGVARRLVRRDPLGVRFDRSATTYWVPVAPDGPGSRHDRPY